MSVQWDDGYADDCSTLGGASSSKAKDPKRKRSSPQVTEFDWALHDVTKISVLQVTGAHEDSSGVERTRISFMYSINTGGKWVRQTTKEIGLRQALSDDSTCNMYWCTVLKFLCDLLVTTPSEEVMMDFSDSLNQCVTVS